MADGGVRKYFPRESGFSLPKKCISLEYVNRERELPDTVHASEVYGEVTSNSSRRNMNRQISPAVFTALEEFSRPLAFLKHDLDASGGLSKMATSISSSTFSDNANLPAFRSSCAPVDEEAEGSETSPVLNEQKLATDPSRPAKHAIFSTGYGAPSERFLCNYHPNFRPDAQVRDKLRRLESLKVLLKERPVGYQWLSVEFTGMNFQTPQFEPLFVSLALYYIDFSMEKNRQTLLPETSARVSEALYFDVAADSLVQKFPEMFHVEPQHLPTEVQDMLSKTPANLSGQALAASLEVSESDPGRLKTPTPSDFTKVKAGCIMIPRTRTFRNPSLVVVAQVFKVLQGEPDKVQDPYRVPARSRVNHQQLCLDAERLGKFLQPLGMAYTTVYNSDGQLRKSLKKEKNLPGAASTVRDLVMYRTKAGMTDVELMEQIVDIQNGAQVEYEHLTFSMELRISEVGRTPDFPQNQNGIPPFRTIDPHMTKSTSGAQGGSSSTATTPTSAASASASASAASDNDALKPYAKELVRFPLVNYSGAERKAASIIRSRLNTSHANPMQATLASAAAHAIMDAPATPTNAQTFSFPDALGEERKVSEILSSDVTRAAEKALKTYPQGRYQNLIFVQPEALAGFRHRNLAVRVELRDLQIPASSSQDGGRALPAIFNTKQGPSLVTEQILPVTYHSREPRLNGQVKVALPLKLTSSVILYFTVFHVHVKDKNLRRGSTWRSGAFSSVFGGKDKGEQEPFRVTDVVAKGYLPIVQPRGCGELLHNGFHTIHMDLVNSDVDDDEEGQSEVSRKGRGEDNAPGHHLNLSSLDIPGLATSSSQLTLRVLVRTASSIHPSDPGLAALFANAPAALGCLNYPEHVLPRKNMDVPGEETDLALLAHQLSRERNTLSTTGKLHRALTLCLADTSPFQTCEFLLTTLRILLRILCAGSGQISTESWRDSNRFPKMRCQAFLLLPVLLERACCALDSIEKSGEGSDEAEKEKAEASMPDYLQAYVDLLFLEEVPQGQKECVVTPKSSRKTRSDEEIDAIAAVISEKVFDTVCEECLDELAVEGSTDAAARRARQVRCHTVTPAPISFEDVDALPSAGDVSKIYTSDEEPDFEGRKSEGLRRALKSLARSRSMEEENESQMWQLLGSVPAAEDEKWWPWVYEVIITQWHAVLNVVQNAKPPASVADTSVTAGSGSVSLMALEEVTEGDEDEEEDEEGDAPGDAENSVVYPFGADDMPEDFRKDLAKHAPFALKLILKSLALRLCYEGKDPPVLLDNSTAYNLGSLCAALGAEVMSLPLWQRQALNAAMADFFREFMTLVHPEQAGRALRAYLRVLKKHHSVEDFELRIVLLENLSMYDHFVVINSPQVHPGGVTIPSSRVRAIVTGLAFSDEASVRPRSLPSADDGVITSGSSEISAEVPNHWLAELVVNEVMSVVSLHTAEPHVREHAVAVLRQLFVGHTYDPRYQDDLSRRRIANMYLPLLGKTVDSVERLENYAPYSVTRRDLLACLVYLLQDAPANCMHAVYREMCSPGDSTDASSTLQTAKAEAEAKQKTPTRPGWLSSVGGKSPPPPFTHGQLLSAAQVGTVLRREAGVGVLAHRMVQLLRLCLDTFEYPGDEGAGSNLVPGAVPSQDDGKIKGPKGKDALSALDSMMKAGRIAGSGTLSRAERRLQQKGRVRTGRRQFADRRKTGDTLRATRSAPSGHLSPMQTVCATKRQCHIAQAVIHRSFFALVDEAAPGIHCSPGVGENPVLQGSARTFLQEVHIYMLHALEVAQSDDVLVSLLYECKHLIFRFGASTFLESAENGVQDWCRRLLMLCNARVGKVRHSALSVLVYMINCCYLWQRLRRREGRAAVEYLLNPLMAVAPDCFAEMGGPAVGGIGRHAADDIFPHPVTDKASVEREYKAFRVSMEELKRWQSVQSSSAQAGGGGVNEALGQELVAIARTLLALLDAFLADKVILSDMEEAASKAEPASAFSGPLSYVSGPVAAANSALDASGQDLFFMQRTLLRAANCFSHENGPQLRVYYLQRLEALHTATGNRAEAALSALAAADTIDACRAAFERKELWAPHPPRRRIDGQTVAPGPLQIEKRNAGLECCVKARSLLPFGSMEKLDAEFSHYVERAADLLCQIPLPLHVIEAYERLTPRLAAKRDLAKLRDIHEKMTTAFKTADAEELVWRAGEFASYGFAEGGGMQNLGVYFRVLVFGAAPSTFLENAKTPASLIGDPRVVTNAHAEFVYRFPPLVQLVTATQAISNLLTAELRAILGDAELPSIEILPDRADEDELLKGAGSQKLYVKITLVRPVPEEVARAEGRTNLGGKAGEAVLEEVAEDAVQGIASGCKDSGMIISQQLAYPEFGERYDHFEFSVPFTASGKMQGSTSEQCKKLTYLSVNHAFPTLHTRVKVVRRRAILMSPIDCAVDDLSKRCVQMRMELAKPPTAVDKQALMRLVSGSVIPQVNGGAMEIAECFLSRVNMSNPIHLVNDEEMLQAKRRALASELLVFLTLCKELVNRTRHVLGITEQMIRQPPPDSPGDDGAREENTDITWQREVEKGLENMKAFMKPMVLQYNVEGADVFFSDARAKQHS